MGIAMVKVAYPGKILTHLAACAVVRANGSLSVPVSAGGSWATALAVATFSSQPRRRSKSSCPGQTQSYACICHLWQITVLFISPIETKAASIKGQDSVLDMMR